MNRKLVAYLVEMPVKLDNVMGSKLSWYIYISSFIFQVLCDVILVLSADCLLHFAEKHICFCAFVGGNPVNFNT